MERNYYLAFSLMPGIGPKKFDLLIRNFGSAENAWEGDAQKLKEILGEKLYVKFEKFQSEFNINFELEKLTAAEIEFVCLFDKEYPKNLASIPNAPVALFLKGNLQLLKQVQKDKTIAIVGTRNITAYGKSVTELFSGSLAQAGLIVVSGLALGVDGLAHVACLKVNGKTIAVLGSGVDICYPSENQKIYDEILANDGLILSELYPGTMPTAGTFPARNRIVAGLSDGILVTEGAEDSGSLITANFGLEFGRKVFAVPGPITSSLSAAPLRLIEKGAILVVSPEDILRSFNLPISNDNSINNELVNKNLTKDERKILELIANESLLFDEIVRRLKMDSAIVGTLISMMELKGLVKKSDGVFSPTQKT